MSSGVMVIEFFSNILPNFSGILSLWFRIILYMYLIQITPYLSTWSIQLYIKGLRMLFQREGNLHVSKDKLIVTNRMM